jgi:hypothetical protein
MAAIPATIRTMGFADMIAKSLLKAEPTLLTVETMLPKLLIIFPI